MNRESAPQIPAIAESLTVIQREIGKRWATLPDDPDEALEITGEHEIDFNQPINKEA